MTTAADSQRCRVLLGPSVHEVGQAPVVIGASLSAIATEEVAAPSAKPPAGLSVSVTSSVPSLSRSSLGEMTILADALPAGVGAVGGGGVWAEPIGGATARR